MPQTDDIPSVRLSDREFIYMLLLSDGEMHGRQLYRAYKAALHRGWTCPYPYSVLDRMVKRGLAESREGEPEPKHGNRKRRYFKLTHAGRATLARYRQHVKDR